MHEDTLTDKRQVLQAVRLQLGMTIHPQILSLGFEIALYERQFSEIDKLSLVRETDFTVDELSSITKIMLDQHIHLRDIAKILRDDIENTLSDLPELNSELCTFLNDVRVTFYHMRAANNPILGSISLLRLWLEACDMQSEHDILSSRLNAIFEISTKIHELVGKIEDSLIAELRGNKDWCTD